MQLTRKQRISDILVKNVNIYSVEGQKPSNFLFKKKLSTPQLVVEMQKC